MCRNKKPRPALGPGIEPRHRAKSCYKIGPIGVIGVIGVIGNISLDISIVILYIHVSGIYPQTKTQSKGNKQCHMKKKRQ